MKIIQLNTWSCKLSPEIVRLLKEEGPDIIAMQEVISTKLGGKVLDTIEDIFDQYPFRHRFYTPLVEFAFMHNTAQRGNLIAANYDISQSTQIWTHGSFAKDFDYISSGGYNIARNFAHSQIETPQGIVHVLTLHGYHIKEHKNGNEETLRACQELVSYVNTLEGAVILTGDFNLCPESESIRLINKTLRNLSVEFKFRTTRNHLTPKAEVCDYIFVNDKVKVNKTYMPSIVASDHNALVLDFDLA